MAEESHYDLLQVQPTADLEIIQAAYRSMMRRYHPDVNPSPEAEDIAKRLNLALETLSDPGRRAAYDRELASRTGGTAGRTRQQGSAASSRRPTPPRPPPRPTSTTPPPRPPQPPPVTAEGSWSPLKALRKEMIVPIIFLVLAGGAFFLVILLVVLLFSTFWTY